MDGNCPAVGAVAGAFILRLAVPPSLLRCLLRMHLLLLCALFCLLSDAAPALSASNGAVQLLASLMSAFCALLQDMSSRLRAAAAWGCTG